VVRAAALTPGPVAIVIRLSLARGWRTDLPRLVLLLQAGNAVSFFGYGLILPFEIIYLHQIRGFATATAGLVLAAILGTATLVTPPSGTLLDHFRPKPILIAGNLTSALGYAGFAFVDRPWQAFACAVVGGAGIGAARTANQTLRITLVTPEQRAASFALGRVASNLGLGSGATVAGFIVASAQHLRSFQTLYLFDAITYAAFALVVLAMVPNRRAAAAHASAVRGGFRAVARDRRFLIVIAVEHRPHHRRLRAVLEHPAAVCDSAYTRRTCWDRDHQARQHALHRDRADPRDARRQADAPSTGIRRGERALGDCAPRRLAGDADPLGARGDRAPGRRRNRVRDRRVRPRRRPRPLVADLAPPHLLGRYMSMYALMATGGLALGPAISGLVLATSPDAVWWGGALVAAVIGAGFLLSGDRIPEPLAVEAGVPDVGEGPRTATQATN
jgi:MFS family permease